MFSFTPFRFVEACNVAKYNVTLRLNIALEMRKRSSHTKR